MTRSPAFHPVTGSASMTVVEPAFAVAPSFTQVRDSGWPCDSHRPPQQTIAGQLSLFIPGAERRTGGGSAADTDREQRNTTARRERRCIRQAPTEDRVRGGGPGLGRQVGCKQLYPLAGVGSTGFPETVGCVKRVFERRRTT